VGIAALVVTNKYDISKKDIPRRTMRDKYYLYNDYQGSLIAVQKKGSSTLEQLSGVYPALCGNLCSVNVAFGEFTKPKAYMN
jgi:hypothetical protein